MPSYLLYPFGYIDNRPVSKNVNCRHLDSQGLPTKQPWKFKLNWQDWMACIPSSAKRFRAGPKVWAGKEVFRADEMNKTCRSDITIVFHLSFLSEQRLLIFRRWRCPVEAKHCTWLWWYRGCVKLLKLSYLTMPFAMTACIILPPISLKSASHEIISFLFSTAFQISCTSISNRLWGGKYARLTFELHTGFGSASLSTCRVAEIMSISCTMMPAESS